MGKIFNDLVYSNYVPTYAGLPIAEADEAAGVLENRYYQNKDMADKLEIAIANIEVNEEDQWIKDGATSKLRDSLKATVERGDYENASLLVRNEAKDFATNQGVLNAIKSAQGKKTQTAAAQERVGKSEEENGILQEDVDYMVNKGNSAYKKQGGIYFDKATNTWKGHWNMGSIPKYINVGDRADKFLNEAKPDTYIGRQMTEDGVSRVMQKQGEKWMWVEEETTKDGSYIYKTTTEEVTYEQAYQAARNHVTQAGDVQDRMRFEATKNYVEFQDYLNSTSQTQGQAKKAMIDDLSRIAGFSEDELSKKTTEDLYDLWNYEKNIYERISGAVAKHSYTKEQIVKFGEPWWSKEASNARSSARAGGGNWHTPDNNRIINEYLTDAYGISSTATSKNLAGYSSAKAAIEKEVETHSANLESLINRKNSMKAQGMNTAGIEDQIAQAKSNLDKYIGKAADMDLFREYVIEELKDEYGDDVFEKFNTERDRIFTKDGFDFFPQSGPESGKKVHIEPKELKKAEELNAKLESFVTGLGTMGLDATKAWGLAGGASGTSTQLDIIKSNLKTMDHPNDKDKVKKVLQIAKDETIKKMKKAGTYTPDLEKKLDDLQADIYETVEKTPVTSVSRGANALYAYEKSDTGKQEKIINKKMKEITDHLTYAYTYVDLSSGTDSSSPATKLGDLSGRSFFTRTTTQQVKNNPANFSVVGKDGKVIPFNSKSPGYDHRNTMIIGMTEQYIPNVGYCLVAKEWQTDKDGNVTNDPPREILLQPNSVAKRGIMAAARREIQSGTFVSDKGRVGGKTYYDPESSSIQAKLWEYDEVDEQLAIFTVLPTEMPDRKKGEERTSIGKTIYSNEFEIDITRNVDLVGNVTFDAVYKDRKTGKVQHEIGYSNINDVQLEIEALNGGNPAFTVPFASLERVIDSNKSSKLKYANANDLKSSAPFLQSDFLVDMQNLENEMKLPYEVKSFLRSNYANDYFGGAANSPFVQGRGIDINGSSAKGKKILEWLKSNSKNKIINNSKLRYNVIERGGEKVIQIYK